MRFAKPWPPAARSRSVLAAGRSRTHTSSTRSLQQFSRKPTSVIKDISARASEPRQSSAISFIASGNAPKAQSSSSSAASPAYSSPLPGSSSPSTTRVLQSRHRPSHGRPRSSTRPSRLLKMSLHRHGRWRLSPQRTRLQFPHSRIRASASVQRVPVWPRTRPAQPLGSAGRT